MRPTITTVGSYAVGLTMYTQRFPSPGETVLGRNFKSLHGGKGSNQAIAVARLGGQSLLVGRVGTDEYGAQALELLRSEGVDTTHVHIDDRSGTGVGFVVVDDSGNNEIVIDFGANNAVSPSDVEKAENDIARSQALLVQLEVGIAAVEKAVRTAHRHGVKVILNPAPFQPISREVLSLVDILTPNETEAAMLLGMEGETPTGLEGPALGERLHKKFGCIVVLTMGAAGACIVRDGTVTLSEALRVSAVDTTGAGDTFSAALTVALSEGKGLREAARFANVAAALSVTKEGVVPSIPAREEVDSWLAARGEASAR